MYVLYVLSYDLPYFIRIHHTRFSKVVHEHLTQIQRKMGKSHVKSYDIHDLFCCTQSEGV
jgi:hypothetical protein